MDIKKTIKSLEQRGFEVHYFDTKAEAADYICNSLSDTSIGFGGSMTVKALGIYDRLAKGNAVYDHSVTPGWETKRSAATAAVYISGVNGISETGELINIDGHGNRVSATLFDKKRVIFVSGVNKISDNLDSAISRARNVAGPKNAQRLNKSTPCAKNADQCYDCRSKERICNALVIHMGAMSGVERTEVVLIGEELGY